MSNRMDKVFSEVLRRGEKILVLYFPIGDTILGGDDCAWAGRYFENGCTVLEIGLPNGNPVLDGKTVADSMARALSHTGLEAVFKTIGQMRERYPDNILQVMVYHHVIRNTGLARFAQLCSENGVDGVLCPNIPEEEMPEIDAELAKYGIYNLRFSNYHITDAAVEDLKAHATGYIFQQAVDGATGAQPTVSPQIGVNVKRLKEAGIKMPVLAGFGISNAQQAREAIAMGADGVIVGSATISHIMVGDGEAFIESLGEAMK